MELGWIDFSQKDRQKALDVMSLLQEQGAVDELGIGIVRDAFANKFFPGTSTIQTRAKYFLIVPYCLRDAVDGRFGRNVEHILKKIDEDEKACGKRLMDNSPGEEGIIGSRVLPENGWVARTPSEIYWNGIHTYGIFRYDNLSIREYVSLSSKAKNEKGRMDGGNRADDSADVDQDDRDAGEYGNMVFWNLPLYSANWREQLQIGLTKTEADFLKEQIIHTTESSLLSYILKNQISVDLCNDFASLTALLEQDIDRHTADLMHLACHFSDLVYLARVRYNLILSEGANRDAVQTWDDLKEEIPRHASVNLNAVFAELKIKNPQTFSFLAEVQKCFLEERFEDADKRIREREIFLKGAARAKLSRPKEYDPQNWVGGKRLDYRFPDAKRIIQDIYAGEVSDRVSPK